MGRGRPSPIVLPGGAPAPATLDPRDPADLEQIRIRARKEVHNCRLQLEDLDAQAERALLGLGSKHPDAAALFAFRARVRAGLEEASRLHARIFALLLPAHLEALEKGFVALRAIAEIALGPAPIAAAEPVTQGEPTPPAAA